MRHFAAIVHQEGDSAFGLIFPDLPGRLAAADDWNALLSAATEAVDPWFEDMRDVEPSSLDTLRQCAAVREELAAGGVLLFLSYIPANRAVERINVTAKAGLRRAIDRPGGHNAGRPGSRLRRAP